MRRVKPRLQDTGCDAGSSSTDAGGAPTSKRRQPLRLGSLELIYHRAIFSMVGPTALDLAAVATCSRALLALTRASYCCHCGRVPVPGAIGGTLRSATLADNTVHTPAPSATAASAATVTGGADAKGHEGRVRHAEADRACSWPEQLDPFRRLYDAVPWNCCFAAGGWAAFLHFREHRRSVDPWRPGGAVRDRDLDLWFLAPHPGARGATHERAWEWANGVRWQGREGLWTLATLESPSVCDKVSAHYRTDAGSSTRLRVCAVSNIGTAADSAGGADVATALAADSAAGAGVATAAEPEPDSDLEAVPGRTPLPRCLKRDSPAFTVDALGLYETGRDATNDPQRVLARFDFPCCRVGFRGCPYDATTTPVLCGAGDPVWVLHPSHIFPLTECSRDDWPPPVSCIVCDSPSHDEASGPPPRDEVDVELDGYGVAFANAERHRMRLAKYTGRGYDSLKCACDATSSL